MVEPPSKAAAPEKNLRLESIGSISDGLQFL